MNYPNGIRKTSNITYGNRGMSLEEDINQTNQYYLENNIAIIHKKPVSISVRKVDYKARNNAVIKEALFLVPSTTDYNGLYKGNYIDFEAKETKKNYLPLSNIHKHQITHLKKIEEHKGISFIIVRFTSDNETFLLETKYLIAFIDSNIRKSIPKEYFIKYGYIIKWKYTKRVDYIEIIDKLRSEI